MGESATSRAHALQRTATSVSVIDFSLRRRPRLFLAVEMAYPWIWTNTRP